MIRNYYQEEKFLIELFQNQNLTIKEITEQTWFNKNQVIALMRKHKNLFSRRRNNQCYVYQLKPGIYRNYLEGQPVFVNEDTSSSDNEYLKNLYDTSKSSNKVFLKDMVEYLTYCFSFQEVLFLYYSLDIISKAEYASLSLDFSMNKEKAKILFLKVTSFFQGYVKDQNSNYDLIFLHQEEVERYFTVLETSELLYLLNISTLASSLPMNFKNLLQHYILFLNDVYSLSRPAYENKILSLKSYLKP